MIERTRDDRLNGINTHCYEDLTALVRRLEQVRLGNDSAAKRDWLALREAVFAA